LVEQVNNYSPSEDNRETKMGCDSHHCACSGDAAQTSRRELGRIALGALLFVAGIGAGYAAFPGATYAQLALFLIAYGILGGAVVAEALKNFRMGRVFDENFLMSLATLGAFLIGEFPEAVAVMLFYRVGEYFQSAAVARSKKSIADLMDIRPDSATVERAGEFVRLAPEAVAVGETLLVKPGEKIPLDGVVTEGRSTLDTRALTGESMPRSVDVGDTVLSGVINQGGVLRVTVTKTAQESTVAKILDLVEHAADKKSPTENFITVFSKGYTPIVVGLAFLLAVIPPLFLGGAWSEWLHRGLVFLVISCPCALVISIPLGFFGGIGGASRRGILIKGGNFLEALNHLDMVVFDKTGTLTRGVFEVTKIHPANGFSTAQVRAYAARAERFSTHPIARVLAVLADGDVLADGNVLADDRVLADGNIPVDSNSVDGRAFSEYEEIAGQGVSAWVDGARVLAGNARLMSTFGIELAEPEASALNEGTQVHVAVDGRYAGLIVISDVIREDSRHAIEGLKRRGIRKTVMLTGDNTASARSVAATLGLDAYHAELLPAQKVEKMEALVSEAKGKIAFVGDGVNDAPVLARADIGIAMGGLGSDAAIEAADIVLMTDEPARLLDAIDIARMTKRIVWQNIVFALGVKIVFLILAVFGVTTMWEAVFADVGVSVLAIVNAMRVMRGKTANDAPLHPPRPAPPLPPFAAA
jgi:Cd2+/Zn2+-exporting ATPase